jgi:hypothetical protein
MHTAALAFVASVAVALPGLAMAELSEDELADIVHNPSMGLYKGYAEFKMAHYDNVRQIWQALVDNGNAEAWFNLGLLAEDGLGEAQNMVEALARYTRGAEAGSTKAQYRLARIYLDGQGVPADPARGEAWLARAAEGGDDAAKEELATLRAGTRRMPSWPPAGSNRAATPRPPPRPTEHCPRPATCAPAPAWPGCTKPVAVSSATWPTRPSCSSPPPRAATPKPSSPCR